MKKVINIIRVVALVAVSFSCLKVIEVPLNEADRKVVVEGNLYDIQDKSYIKLSRSGSVYDDSGFEKISDATIMVSDDLGNFFTFIEDVSEAGTYRDPLFIAQPNRLYTLSITTVSGEFTAESRTSSPVAFDSLDYEVYIQETSDMTIDTNYLVFYNFSDLAEEDNYYRAVPELSSGIESDAFYIEDDRLFSGSNLRQPFWEEVIRPGDTLTAYLLSMDEASYAFYTSLGNGQDSGPFSATASNLATNIVGGALGHFSVYVTDVETIIFP